MFLCFSNCKFKGDIDPGGGAISDPRSMLGKIYLKLNITMLRTKYRSFGCCGFREEGRFLHVFSIVSLWQTVMPKGWKKVQVGKDQEKAQSERDSHSKNRGGKKKQTDNQALIP